MTQDDQSEAFSPDRVIEESRQNYQAFAERAKTIKNEQIFIEVMGLLKALDDPEWQQHAARLMLMAVDTANGNSGFMCYTCKQKWGRDRGPNVFFAASFLKARFKVVATICQECALETQTEEALVERAIEMLRMEFNFDKEFVSGVSQAGHG
jgi:hypothetical protein